MWIECIPNIYIIGSDDLSEPILLVFNGYYLANSYPWTPSTRIN